jgi:hypothetical protein
MVASEKLQPIGNSWHSSFLVVNIVQILNISNIKMQIMWGKQQIFLYTCAVAVNILSKSNKNISFEEFN